VTEPSPGTEEEAAPPRRTWGLGDAALGYLVAFMLSGLLAGLWEAVSGDTGDTLGKAVLGSVGLWIGMVGAVWVASHRKGSGDLARDMGFVLTPRDIPIGIVTGLACQFVLVPLVYWPFRVNDPTLSRRLEEPARNLSNLTRGPGFALLLLIVVVGAPLVEELFFRGLLLRALAHRFGPVAAIVGSSLAFGLVHYQPLQFLGLVAFGVAQALLAWRTGRLGPGLVSHAVFNLATMVVLASQR
jgi:membrane protease YdiL (CAAX protease family)